MEIKTDTDKESITLDYTAKGFANWTIRVKDEVVTESTINRLIELDKMMKTKFAVNVTSQ
jgi:hypothetical protein